VTVVSSIISIILYGMGQSVSQFVMLYYYYTFSVSSGTA
jgi:hypothetical protein